MRLIARLLGKTGPARTTTNTYAQHQVLQALDNAEAVGALTDEYVEEWLQWAFPDSEEHHNHAGECCDACRGYLDALRDLDADHPAGY